MDRVGNNRLMGSRCFSISTTRVYIPVFNVRILNYYFENNRSYSIAKRCHRLPTRFINDFVMFVNSILKKDGIVRAKSIKSGRE